MNRRPSRDAAGRLLAFAVWLLPATRREWGAAMRGELEQVDGGGARLRFALGCVRAALVQPSAQRALGHLGGTAAAVAAVLAAGIVYPGARVLVVTLTLVLAALAWLGGRPGLFGPVASSPTARVIRTAGYAVAVAYLLVAVRDLRGPQYLRPELHIPLSMIMLVLYTAVMLAATARGSAARPAALAYGTAAGVVAGAAGFALIPFERVMPPLADALPGQDLWPALTLVGALAAAMFAVARRTGDTAQVFMAVLCAGAVGCAVVTVLGDAAWLLFPERMPNIVPLNAGSPQVRQALSRMEAGDEYVAAIVWGSLLAGVLATMIRPVVRRRTAVLRTLTFAGAALTSLAATAGEQTGAVLSALTATVLGILTLTTAPRREGTRPSWQRAGLRGDVET
ncbi:hypothetical protein [Sphaerisporangium rhizosphaerae]|uniref:Uncharacterized protein n=1 Tax=Sphaerisporangium rhizosphaerae TaxID=2269375 RepID=A0ABW2P0H7_9ACTN